MLSKVAAAFLAALSLTLCASSMAQETQIRKHITERLPKFPKIDEIRKTAFPGMYELRSGDDIYYADAEGDFIIQGQVIDTKSRENLTQTRVDQLRTIDFSALPLKDAFARKFGNGTQKLAIFTDPNCPYCRRLEQSIHQLKNVTVYTFLMPVLGPDSLTKSRDIWCSADAAKAWDDWMLTSTPVRPAQKDCDASALQRNVALGRQLRITGTPGTITSSGRLIQGAISLNDLELLLAATQVGKQAH